MSHYNFGRVRDGSPYSGLPPIPGSIPPSSIPPPVVYYPPGPPASAWDRRLPPGCPMDPEFQGWEPSLRRIGGSYDEFSRPYPEDYRGRVETPPYGRDGVFVGRDGGGLGREGGYVNPHRRPPSPTTLARRQMLEIEDQLKMCKEEIAKKDKLINQLTSVEMTNSKDEETTKADERMLAEKDREISEAKTEISSLKSRVENLQKELSESKADMDTRERRINELTAQLNSLRDSETQHSQQAETLRAKVAEYESKTSSVSDTTSESSSTVTLQDSKVLEHRIQELEARLRSSHEDLDSSERQRARVQQQLDDIIQQLGILGIDGPTTSNYAIESVRTVMQENLQLKAQRETMRSQIEMVEIELKTANDTMRRQMTEIERYRQDSAKHVLDMEAVRLDKDRAVGRQKELEGELESLRSQLESGHRSAADVHRDFDQARRRVHELERDLENMEIRHRASEIERGRASEIDRGCHHVEGGSPCRAETQLEAFKEALALVLSGDYTRVEPREEQIGERVESLIRAVKEKSARITMLEEQLSELHHELKRSEHNHVRSEHNHAAGRRSILKNSGEMGRRLDERSTESLERSLRYAEDEMRALAQLKNELKVDRDNYLRFIEEMSKRLRMDPQTLDMGVEEATNAILARVEQVMSNEASNHQAQKTQIYNLQRKLKSLKEQIDSKDLHMDLLRKKVASLEERLAGRVDVERDREEEQLRNRKLSKLNERYKSELHEAEVEIRELKARLLQSTEIQTRIVDKEKAISALEEKVNHLEHVRLQQANRLADVEGDLNNKSEELSRKKDLSSNTIQSLTSELRTTKIAFDDLAKREQQLLDLRQVIARMLGLHIDRLAVPDYEIVSRLEKLVLANQANAATAYALDSAIADMSDGFRAGYDEATATLASATRGHNVRSFSPVRGHRKTDVKIL